MKRNNVVFAALHVAAAAGMAGAMCCPGSAWAQDAGLSVSVGARAWYTEWTTFSYLVQNGNNIALTQVSASNKLLLVPLLSVRYGNFVGSASYVPSTQFSFADGGSGKRKEFDANVGYSVLPGLALTLGYKSVSQRDGSTRKFEAEAEPAWKAGATVEIGADNQLKKR